MSIYDSKSLFYLLKKNYPKEWSNYTKHQFLVSLANNTLPLKAFKKYLIQDYFFLIKFIKILALGCVKSQNNNDLMRCIDFIFAIKNELRLHVLYCKKWKISQKTLLKTPELIETKKYTNYVMAVGNKGDILDLFTALSPCIIGYGEIGYELKKKKLHKNSYNSWIDTYASKEYQDVAKENILYLDSLFSKIKNKKNKLKNLKKIFKKATELESDFWSMSLKD
jgi:thiaminase (transcriptional activator TenA)